MSARELLDRAARRIEQSLAEQPEVKTRLLAAMGEAYAALGLHDDALELFESELKARKLNGTQRGIAQALTHLSGVWRQKEDWNMAKELAQRAIAVAKKTPTDTRSLGLANLALGRAYFSSFELAPAASAYGRALRIFEQLPPEPNCTRGDALSGLALVNWRRGALEKAGDQFSRVLRDCDSQWRKTERRRAYVLNNLALVLAESGEHSLALARYRQGLSFLQAIMGGEHPNVATMLHNVSTELLALRSFASAFESVTQALNLRERAFGSQSLVVADSLSNAGHALVGLMRTDEARPLLHRAISIMTEQLGEESVFLATPLSVLAKAEATDQNWSLAEAALSRALQLKRNHLGDDHRGVLELEKKLNELRAQKVSGASRP